MYNNAVDIHNLVNNTPDYFYNALFEQLKKEPNLKTGIDILQKQLSLTQSGQNDRLNYITNNEFDLSVLKGESIDLVVSNAAFQQFDNPDRTIAQLSEITSKGAYFIALIDLKTHTRWINKRDPLNIYRYPEDIYSTLKFKGAQNRMRPYEFKQTLEKYGWNKVSVFRRLVLDTGYVKSVSSSLHPKFHSTNNEMEILTCVICAQKG